MSPEIKMCAAFSNTLEKEHLVTVIMQIYAKEHHHFNLVLGRLFADILKAEHEWQP